MPKTARHSGRRAARRQRGPGFTLIELLTVVAIIALLVTMVVPTIQSIMQSLNAARTLARIDSLSNGTHMYKMHAARNRYFPGQSESTGKSFLEKGTYAGAGSYLLAKALFTDPDGNFPVEAYAPLEPGMLDDSKGSVLSGVTTRVVPRSILDTRPEPLAILYFPSRKGLEAKLSQFVIKDNGVYTTDDLVAKKENGTKITIEDFAQGGATGVHMDGQFIITGVGRDGLYYGEGALKNWRN